MHTFLELVGTAVMAFAVYLTVAIPVGMAVGRLLKGRS